MNRREAIAALVSAAALPLAHGCSRDSSSAPAATNPEADTLALLNRVAENLLRQFWTDTDGG